MLCISRTLEIPLEFLRVSLPDRREGERKAYAAAGIRTRVTSVAGTCPTARLQPRDLINTQKFCEFLVPRKAESRKVLAGCETPRDASRPQLLTFAIIYALRQQSPCTETHDSFGPYPFLQRKG
jgi:hypothetical protein